MFSFDAETLFRVTGIAGVAFYLVSYGMLQAGLIRGSGYTYAFLNLAAAGLVLTSLTQDFNLASALIQIFWILISLFGITRIFLLNHRIRFNSEEEDLVGAAFDEMPRPIARRLLSRGTWADWEPGTTLTEEGIDVSHLHFLAEGEAAVWSGGKEVARLRRGLIGEMNVMKPGPASATVIVAARSRVFSISGEVLRQLAAKDSELKLNLERHLSVATRRKLIEANARLARRESA